MVVVVSIIRHSRIGPKVGAIHNTLMWCIKEREVRETLTRTGRRRETMVQVGAIVFLHSSGIPIDLG